MDSVQMWELYGQLTWKGEGEFRAKLMEMSRLVEQVQRQINNLGTGGGAGGIGASGPGSTPLRPNFLYGGGVGGAPVPEARMPPPLPPPPPPAGTNTATPQTPDSPPPSGANKPFTIGALQYQNYTQKRSTIGAINYPDYSWMKETRPSIGAINYPDYSWMKETRPSIGAINYPDYSWMNQGKTSAPGPIPTSRLLPNAGELEAAEAAGQKKFNIPGLHYPALRERVSGGLMGSELVGIGARKELDELAKKSKAAGDTIGQLGLRHAWIIRSATAGGPLGMAGGALGAGIGHLLGNMGFGALMGNLAGQSIKSGLGGMQGLVGEFSPGSAKRYERAEADLRASFGEALVPTMDVATKTTRNLADLTAVYNKEVASTLTTLFKFTGLGAVVLPLGKMIDTIANRAGVAGAAQGKAISPLGGHVFGGPDELYRAVAAMTMMYSDQGPQQAEMKATIPGSSVPLTNPKPPGREGHIGAMMDAIWINPLTGTMIT